MKIGDKVIMNKYSNYAGLTGSVIKVASDNSDLMIKLETGLIIKAPIEVVI